MFWKKSKLVANVDTNRCRNCKYCEWICRRRVLESHWISGKYTTFVNHPERCVGCGKCVEACPEDAIELIRRYC
ncbi:4Fe-4S dicluster domain-containing protein [Segatella cerevisiae]|jgi:NAD-dependent dihydropyrimidine dehydrogenase PreA subunit|uniref:4Fe-4S dicluster domain-containing protein n=1 Tax=Segatella cerevisiae TaxID=2053716 RepID=UPI00374CE1E9